MKQSRGSAKYWIPQLCQASKEENSNNLPNEDIRDRRVKRGRTSIWQKEDTIRDALPDTRMEESGLYCFVSYTKRNRQVHDSHDRGSAVAVVVVAIGR
ncbi:MAG TPA: hypothetical protein VFS97_13410 [Nitrososphaeraceae archaeon]|nr:hypothetical protein [Nitrososphaeraceae archaeon]